jgi:hypothetical protein
MRHQFLSRTCGHQQGVMPEEVDFARQAACGLKEPLSGLTLHPPDGTHKRAHHDARRAAGGSRRNRLQELLVDCSGNGRYMVLRVRILATR